MRYILMVCICLTAIHANAQRHIAYSKQDSVKAQAYFDSSWNYSLGSQKHQLYLDSALAIIPTHAYYWQQKSMPLYKAQKYELGKPFLDSAVKYNPSRWLEYRAVLKCIFERNYTDALKDFYKAKALYGNRPVMDHPYNFFIGLCHLQLNHFDSSEYYFTGCVNEERKAHGDEWVHPNHWFYLGIVHYEKRNYKQAIECFDKALKIYRKFADAQYYKSFCLREINKPDEALVLMEEAYTNFKEGNIFNEDNALYELYPYQVRKYYISNAIKRMRAEAEKTNK